MNVNDTLELDYLVEQISDDTIDITSKPTTNSYSMNYVNRRTGIFDPTETGTFQLDINGQVIEIEVTDIPNSVVNQYVAPNFANPWPDEIGTADMSIDGGLTTTTIKNETFVTGDGTDDAGTSSADVLGNRNQFGIAYTINTASADVGDYDVIAGLSDSGFNDVVRLRVVNDNAEFDWRSGGSNDVLVEGDTIADGATHAVVINKTGNSSSDIEIYVDDMNTDTATVVQSITADPTNWSYSGDWGFWAENINGSLEDYINADIGTIEFNTEPYSQTEREKFVSRRPEV